MASLRKKYAVAIIGATGLVGRKLLQILEERNFPIGEIKLIASQKSAGSTIEFKGKDHKILPFKEDELGDVDFAFFCAGGNISKKYAPIAEQMGAWVIDKSSTFRLQEGIPLVVPEVNGEDITQSERKIVSTPNCSTIPLTMVLYPLMKHWKIERVIVSTYQSVSGAGKEAIDEMLSQARAVLDGTSLPSPAVFPQQIAFNLLPHIDIFYPSGYTKEEMKLINESKKILHSPELLITCTAVRVPVMVCHSEAITIDFNSPVSIEAIKQILSDFPGVKIVDDPSSSLYPTPVQCEGSDLVYVGRIRREVSRKTSVNLWIVCDNLRKGAATNGVQIAEHIVKMGLAD